MYDKIRNGIKINLFTFLCPISGTRSIKPTSVRKVRLQKHLITFEATKSQTVGIWFKSKKSPKNKNDQKTHSSSSSFICNSECYDIFMRMISDLITYLQSQVQHNLDCSTCTRQHITKANNLMRLVTISDSDVKTQDRKWYHAFLGHHVSWIRNITKSSA